MKISHTQLPCRAAILSAAFLLTLASASKAALSYTVTMNVTSLVGNPNAPFWLDVQLATGSGNVGNTVTLSNFQMTGGAFTGAPVTGGDVSGSFAGTLTLGNTSANSYFAQAFSNTMTRISFDVSQTTNSEFVGTGTAIPDQFNVFIDDSNTADGYVPTTDPSGNDTLVSSTIFSGETYKDVVISSSTASDAGVTVGVVPEPGSAALLVLGGLGFLARRSRARRA